MSIFSWFRKDSPARALIGVQRAGQPIATPRNYAAFASEGYQKNVIAFSCVDMIGQAVASLHWLIFQKRNGTVTGSFEHHPLLDILAQPNPLQDRTDFLGSVVAYLLLSGNSYINGVGPGDGTIRELWPLRPDRMTIIPGGNGLPAAFDYSIGGQKVRFQVDQVRGSSPILHLKTFNPLDDWYGMARIEAASLGIDTHNQANLWNLSLLQNGAKPDGALVVSVSEGNPSGRIAEDQFARLQEQLQERHSGARNAGRSMVLEGGLDWKQMGLSPKDMDWLEGKDTSARDVARAFGVPVQLLGIPGDNTYSNLQEAEVAFYRKTILPLANAIKVRLNNWFVRSKETGLYLDYDKDEIEALAPLRDAKWKRIDSSTFLTVNEKREALGYEEVDNGDQILVSNLLVPLEQVGKQPVALNPDGTPLDPADAEDPASGDAEDPEDSDDAGDSDEGVHEEDDDSADPKKSRRRGAELKVFNLADSREKKREWRKTVRLRAGFERKLARQAHALFEVEAHGVVKAVQGLDPDAAKGAAMHAIAAHAKMWNAVLESNLTAVGKSFGNRVLAAIKTAGEPPEAKDASDIRFKTFLDQWVKDHAGKRISLIQETTRDDVLGAIQDAIQEGIDDGSGIPDIAKAIQETYDDFSDARSVTIARTEVLAASNAASLGAAKASGASDLQKEWIAADDERTRDDHRKADGQVVGIDENFEVGGSAMAQPGDPSAPPEEVINCRCTVAFLRGGT